MSFNEKTETTGSHWSYILDTVDSWLSCVCSLSISGEWGPQKKFPFWLIALEEKAKAKLFGDMTSFLVLPSTTVLRQDIFSQYAYWIFWKAHCPQSSLLWMHLAGLFYIYTPRTSLFRLIQAPSRGFTFRWHQSFWKILLCCLCVFFLQLTLLPYGPSYSVLSCLSFACAIPFCKPQRFSSFLCCVVRLNKTLFLQENTTTTAPCQIDLRLWSAVFCMADTETVLRIALSLPRWQTSVMPL